MRRRADIGRIGFSLLAVLALLVLAAVPAVAEHKEGHGQIGASSADDSRQKSDKDKQTKDNDGDADRDPETSYTEDNDTNDGGTKNNVSDDGDNAHPSGKDRSVENGKSGNQGKAESDPDDDGRGPDRTNGGPDKPNGSGGVDKADQDGNNGCGNDDDFEDDNEGWCLRNLKKTKGGVDGTDSVLDVEVDCFTVTVSSMKDISNVEVAFADGSIVKFDGLSGHSWTKTFTKEVQWAKAKSGTTVVYGSSSADCDDDDVLGDDTGGDSVVVDVDCYTVTVTSTKDISNVEVGFEDGSVVKFDGLSGYTWTKTFTKAVDWAKAKSGTTVVSETNSEDCDDDDVLGDDTGGDSVVVDVDCYTVTVTSTKDISHVEVAFADGSIVKFDGLSGHSWTKTFTTEVKWAKAKSGTTVVSETNSEDCDVEGDEEVCDADLHMPGTQPCDDDDVVCDADATMPGVQPCGGDDDEVEGDEDGVERDEDTVGPGNEDRGNGDAPPIVQGETLTNDDGPGVAAAGERDSNEDEVLGAVLPFTGASLVAFLLGALALIAGGFSLLRSRKN